MNLAAAKCAIFALLILANPVWAEDFWAHRVDKQVDLPYGDDEPQNDFFHSLPTGGPVQAELAEDDPPGQCGDEPRG